MLIISIGAVLLPLTSAKVSDPDNIGLEYWHAGLQTNTQRQELVNQRQSCYDLVLDSLLVFEDKSAAANNPSSIANEDSPETVRSHAYELAFASEDEMFHSTLYDWLISRNLEDDLLEVC